jgi:amidase
VNASELAFSSASEQARLIRRRELSPVELVQTYLERIDRLDPQLNAYVTVDGDAALAQARDAEAAPSDRPFHGVPIAIKDMTDTAGLRTTYSSRAFRKYVPDEDVALVRRLREAGFGVLGKTNLSEFGTLAVTESLLNGPCRNPWDPALNAGGSSGGAAAALAAGLCPVAHGTDGGGSIRIPASCCGAFGLKPARGRISRAPYAAFEGLPTDGPIARSVSDAAAFLDATAGYELGDPWWLAPPSRPFAEEAATPPGRLRIAVTVDPPVDVPVEEPCVRAVRETGRLLAELGHDVEETAPDWRDRRLPGAFAVVWQVGAALMPVDDLSLVDPVNRVLTEAARETSSAEYGRAVITLSAWARRVIGFWSGVDVLVTPTMAVPQVKVGWLTGEETDIEDGFDRSWRLTPFTCLANITGLPAASVPLGWENGLPVGVQLIGPPAGEAVLIRLAAQLEEARPWRDRRPPVS